jgi:hypothetical protein
MEGRLVASKPCSETLAGQMLGCPLTLDQFRTKIWNQLRWTNRALHNRCRSRYTIDEFTRTPLRAVHPNWRDDRVYWAKLKHHRAQHKSSLCGPNYMAWYYSSGAKCVHEHEGAWNDPNSPYWGGFQADLSFQATYNPSAYRRYGTADNWPIIEQIKMAYNGHKARGWYPWPNTARMCGLL